jgi:uncharacterized protein YbjT (DUF2867 family)
MSRVAVLAGATGLVGGFLLRQLAARAEYGEIRVLGRRPPDLEAGKVRFVATDYADLSGLSAELAAEDVFCCLGTTIRKAGSRAAFERVDYHMVVDLARTVQKAGARRFIVVSAAGASPRSPAFYSRVKARMEETVAALPFEAVHILRPSLLLGERAESRPAEQLAQRLAPLVSPLMVGPLRRYRPIHAAEVAGAMVRMALSGPRGAHVHALPL